MNIDKRSRAIRERVVLTVYALYTVAMAIVAILFQWSSWIVPVIFAGLTVCCILYFKKYKEYEFRALVTTIMMWMNLSIYLLNSDDFTGAFSTMAAMIILLAIYCIPELSYVGVAVYTGHLLYHFIFQRDLDISLSQEGIQCILRIASVYVAQYVTYRLMKTQVESNAIMLENIDTIKRAEQSKDDFMANMSHEIRTPINTVCGISEMVLRENLPESARDEVMDIQTAGRQLLALVSDILDFSELSSGKMEIIPDTYNITSTVNDILNMAIAKLEGKNIELIVDCDADIPIGLVGDEQKIRRAITNVLYNAAKFTEEGGIFLSITFRREKYGGNLVVSVQDTGIGMKEETLENLFTSFSQVDTKRNRKASGLGLGLSISKAIVSRMGGFITVNSTYGQGTKVQMVFPQKVNNEKHIVALENPKECRVMLYLDIEKYNHASVREWYTTNIRHMVQQLGIHYRHVASLAECKRRLEQGECNWLFISWKEYCEDRKFFEELSHHMKVVLILDRDHKESIMGSHLQCVYKPFYILTIASVLNGQYVEYVGRNAGRYQRFTAPQAHILVVDDNLMNLKVVEGLLRPYKCRVSVAESGKEALKKLEDARFDMIFMDHMMPEMDGVETFRQIRQKDGSYYQNVPVIALTANAIGGAREMFLQEGFADYVSKPIELSALERVLQKFIPDVKKVRGAAEEAEGSWEQPAEALNIPAEDSETENSGEEASDRKFLEGIDTRAGIRYCGGSLEDYLEIVRTYYAIGTSKWKEIDSSYRDRDWSNYTILVHAVKSTSLGIGATHLSELAKALEAAGKSEDTAYIDAHAQEMLDEYEKVLAVIAADEAVFPDGVEKGTEKEDVESLREISKEDLVSILSKISDALANFDQANSLGGLEELYECQYQGRSLRSMLSSVAEKIGDFDYMEAQEEVEGLKESLYE